MEDPFNEILWVVRVKQLLIPEKVSNVIVISLALRIFSLKLIVPYNFFMTLKFWLGKIFLANGTRKHRYLF